MITSNDMCKRAGITYRQLDYWLRSGVIECIDGQVEPGSGRPRRYDADEAFVARACGDLVGLGMQLAQVMLVADQLRRWPDRRGRVFVDAGGGLSLAPLPVSCYVLDLDDLARGLEETMVPQ